jgi:hypothetical protein
MKPCHALMFLTAVVALLCVLVGLLIVGPQTPRPAAAKEVTLVTDQPDNASQSPLPAAPPSMASPAPEVSMPQTPSPTPNHPPLRNLAKTNDPTNVPSLPANQATRGQKTQTDPLARAALALVGADEWAAIYWYQAINDPNLPANERQDLIEDLNEDGLSDPKHPNVEDLPLIVSRLLIIEEVGPYAMDEVNADAFLEAYKDLMNLANVALGGGEPVR